MNDVAIGIRLQGGPPQVDGWANAYDAHQLGGWPPPEEIAVLTIGGVVAVAMIENVPEEFKDDVYIYRKIMQSDIPEAPGFFRGATYEYVKSDD